MSKLLALHSKRKHVERFLPGRSARKCFRNYVVIERGVSLQCPSHSPGRRHRVPGMQTCSARGRGPGPNAISFRPIAEQRETIVSRIPILNPVKIVVPINEDDRRKLPSCRFTGASALGNLKREIHANDERPAVGQALDPCCEIALSSSGRISIAIGAAVRAMAASGSAAGSTLQEVSRGEDHVVSIEVIVFRLQLR